MIAALPRFAWQASTITGHIEFPLAESNDLHATVERAGRALSLRPRKADVERLCNLYIPDWLSTDGMDPDKIAGFYDDPVKRACDAASTASRAGNRGPNIGPIFGP